MRLNACTASGYIFITRSCSYRQLVYVLLVLVGLGPNTR